MSPRKAHYRTPEHIAQAIRSKRKELLYGPYDCPKCRKKALSIFMDKRKKQINAKCGCGFQNNLKYREIYEPLDYYNKMLDDLRACSK